MAKLDEVDVKILSVMQRDADINVQDLADKVGISKTPCWRRLKKLQQEGFIQKQVALLDRKKLGFSMMAYVQVTMLDHEISTLDKFLRFIEDSPFILECNAIAGNFDYVLKVVVKDTEQLETFLMRQLLSLGVIQSTNTNFILREKKSTTALPL
ncbi:Lrp/AsnC family transcriptional regulator [Marinicella rhabdoformis]|uniref:Lrp/AsnC family transcriptional regulator n=1 Tax=Marinicella rhabdoformis TaxID=2580566 RepID=UPI0015D0597F|nr:Lrp/AsnC family transcriptional regulator [Marinicella rhabdoformis]